MYGYWRQKCFSCGTVQCFVFKRVDYWACIAYRPVTNFKGRKCILCTSSWLGAWDTIDTATQITYISVDVIVINAEIHLVIMVSGFGNPMYLLYRMKGSDASWEDNNEPPPKCLDYSDDEEERRARRSLQAGERKVCM